MSRKTRDAERFFGESLRARPLRPVVETDYTRLAEIRKAQRGRAELLKALGCWLLALLICGVVVSL